MEGPIKPKELQGIREKIAKGDVVDAEIVPEQGSDSNTVTEAPVVEGSADAPQRPPLWKKADRRDYPKLDRTEQSYIVGSYVDENPEKARELAGYWNDFAERNPEVLKLEKFDAPSVKKWAKEKGIKPMPTFDRLSLHRDLAETIAADAKRAQEKEVAEAATKAAETEAPPNEKRPRKPRQLTGEKIPLSRTTPTEADLEWQGGATPTEEAPEPDASPKVSYEDQFARDLAAEFDMEVPPESYDVALPELYNRNHWHDNHAKSEAYRESRAREEAVAARVEERATQDAAPDVPDVEDTTLSSAETAQRYLDYYDTPPAETSAEKKEKLRALVAQLENVDPLEYYGQTSPQENIAPQPVENVTEPTPPSPELIVPQEEADRHNVEQGPAERLTNRASEIDAQTAALGKREGSWIRSWGEKYNRLPMKWKVGIGLTLGAGAALTTGPLFLAAVGGLGFQRVSGGLGMFVHFEDRLLATQSGEKMSKRERQAMAALGTLGYTAAATGAVMGATYLAREAAEPIRSWLGEHWPFGSGGGSGFHAEPIVNIEDKLPDVSVEATRGKGYEFMAKRLWEQLQERGLDPSTLAEGSDLQQLAQADENTINKVVHDLATKHQFYQPDGESVLIKPGSVLGFNENGALQFGEPGGNEVVNASPDAKVTPPYNPETPTPTPEATPEAYTEHTAILDTEGNAIGHEPAGAETPQEQALEGSPSEPSFESLRTEPHIYLDKHGDLIAQGGEKAGLADAIGKYLSAPENADKVVYTSNTSRDGRVEWRMTDGGVEYAETVPRKGFLYKMFGDRLLEPPQEGDLRKLIN